MEYFTQYRGVDPRPASNHPTNLVQVANLIRENRSLWIATCKVRVAHARKDLEAKRRMKTGLPSVTFGGIFRRREKDGLIQYSGLAALDVDRGVTDPVAVREALKQLTWIALASVSPSGNGVKAAARLDNTDPLQHETSVAYACQLLRQLLGDVTDVRQGDVTRLSFLGHDPDVWVRSEGARLVVPSNYVAPAPASEIQPGPPPPRPAMHKDTMWRGGQVEWRRRVAAEVLGVIDWSDDVNGFCVCPGLSKHTQVNQGTDTKVFLDGVPSIHCVHTSCRKEIVEANHELRSAIGIAEKSSVYLHAMRIAGGGDR